MSAFAARYSQLQKDCNFLRLEASAGVAAGNREIMGDQSTKTFRYEDEIVFTRPAIDKGYSINYYEEEDVVLHLIVRPEKSSLVLNERINGVWQKEFILPYQDDMLDQVKIRLALTDGKIALIVNDGDPCSSARFNRVSSTSPFRFSAGILHHRRELAADQPLMGAVDYHDRFSGLNGWAIDPAAKGQPLKIAVRCNGQILATADADIARPDITNEQGEASLCGFRVAWEAFDQTRLAVIAQSVPGAPIEICSALTGAALPQPANLVALDALEFVVEKQAKPEPAGKAAAANEEDMRKLAYRDILESSRLFDEQYYLSQLSSDDLGGLSPIEHFVSIGDQIFLSPNRMFDATWYAHSNFKHPPARGLFHHYLFEGDKAGLRPCPIFDTKWYRETHAIGEHLALVHYLENATANAVAPNRHFSPSAYLELYPDIRDAGMEAFDHWYSWGMFEGRKSGTDFDAAFVWGKYLHNNRQLNALKVFMDVGEKLGWHPSAQDDDLSVHREIRHFSNAGPLFEDLQPPTPAQGAPLANVFSFYLPQFHAIAENDEWWGKGFTEWRNLPRGVPRFAGHYQPRIPRDLGFYELTDVEPLREHARLAQQMGITGFCFYYYNFNGHRLLEKPLDAFVDDPEITMPFSILWANENWTRRWDGMESDVLMAQDYRTEDQDALVADLARYLTHPRYHRVDGRPILYLYRADVIPNCATVIKEMRAKFRAKYDIDPIFVMSQAFGHTDPKGMGFDAALEFPPHKLGSTLSLINNQVEMLDSDFSGQVYDYREAIEKSLADIPTDFQLIKTAVPNWDNDARKQGKGLCFHNSTPQLFQEWITGLTNIALARPFFGEPLIFVNAWNEWCEGAYLEPDCHYGFAYLNALSRGIRPGPVAARAKWEKMLLIGHDAFPAGAQELLINIGKTFKQRFGSEISFLLLDGGALEPRYRELGDLYIAKDHSAADLDAHLAALTREGFTRAITNTTVSGRIIKLLKTRGIQVCSLIHELPTLISDYQLEQSYRTICENSDMVVYPNKFVATALKDNFAAPSKESIMRPQGLYKSIPDVADAAAALRAELGIDANAKVVINIGYLDLRKGADLFVATADLLRERSDIHFVWVGGRDDKTWQWIRHDVQHRGLSNIHFIDYTPNVATFLRGSDAMYITSREDPFPSVVLEALYCGSPVISFAGSGGHADLLRKPELGSAVPYLDVSAAAAAIVEALDKKAQAPAARRFRSEYIQERYDFAEYVADLAAYTAPARAKVSVIVPSYNYARYMAERLNSIFDQSYPVFEIIVLDDASKDGAADAAQDVSDARERQIKLVRRTTNSGNVFRQWKAGIDMAQGDYIWIAEADDMAAPDMLERMIAALQGQPDAVFAYCDSRAVDAQSQHMYDSYKGYYQQLGDDRLLQDGTFAALDFMRRFLSSRNLVLNASAVVWRTEKLRGAFETMGDAAYAFTCAGDWRVYIEGCLQGGSIVYVADPLNVHRRHDDSVTHALKKDKHLKEIQAIHDLVLKVFPKDKAVRKDIQVHMADLKKEWGV